MSNRKAFYLDAAGRRYDFKWQMDMQGVKDREYNRRLRSLAEALEKGEPKRGQTASYFGCTSLAAASIKVRDLLCDRLAKGYGAL
jgi:hypothetical protein